MSSATNRPRARMTARHWHYAVIGLLVLLDLALFARLVYAWQGAQAGSAANLARHKTEFRTMELKTKPLRGLDKKISRAQVDEQAFYDKRFPATYSVVLTELGKLAVENKVLLTRVQYGQGKLDQGLYQINMDATLSGDYAPIVRFINSLERDKIFFLIDGIALSGQQSGTVSLRVRITTYLRAPVNAAATPSADTTMTEQP